MQWYTYYSLLNTVRRQCINCERNYKQPVCCLVWGSREQDISK